MAGILSRYHTEDIKEDLVVDDDTNEVLPRSKINDREQAINQIYNGSDPEDIEDNDNSYEEAMESAMVLYKEINRLSNKIQYLEAIHTNMKSIALEAVEEKTYTIVSQMLSPYGIKVPLELSNESYYYKWVYSIEEGDSFLKKMKDWLKKMWDWFTKKSKEAVTWFKEKKLDKLEKTNAELKNTLSSFSGTIGVPDDNYLITLAGKMYVGGNEANAKPTLVAQSSSLNKLVKNINWEMASKMVTKANAINVTETNINPTNCVTKTDIFEEGDNLEVTDGSLNEYVKEGLHPTSTSGIIMHEIFACIQDGQIGGNTFYFTQNQVTPKEKKEIAGDAAFAKELLKVTSNTEIENMLNNIGEVIETLKGIDESELSSGSISEKTVTEENKNNPNVKLYNMIAKGIGSSSSALIALFKLSGTFCEEVQDYIGKLLAPAASNKSNKDNNNNNTDNNSNQSNDNTTNQAPATP